VALAGIRIVLGDFDRHRRTAARSRRSQRVRFAGAFTTGARCRIARPPITEEHTMNTATDLSTARPLDNAADQAHRAVDRAKEKAAPMLQRAATAAHKTIDTVAEKSAPAAQWVSDNGKQLATKSTQLADVYSERVRARPFVYVAAALAAGYIVGKLLQR